MIASVHGILEYVGPDHVVVQVGGVGLQVQVPSSAPDSLGEVGSQVSLYTSLILKDDALALYGFPTPEDKRLFELLIGVSGVGPKLALSLLSVMTAGDAAVAIVSSNADLLEKVPGVGKRTAGRIILDLQARLEQEWGVPIAVAQQAHGDLATALGALGYSASEIHKVVADLGGLSGMTLEEQVRRALQRLAG
ncbi:MAG: Holliday junction branch migration protein RuvA [Chloroflexi bacterium]|nr:Holliday junction branch migration protein RuvA [Chloroflexota bacterium]